MKRLLLSLPLLIILSCNQEKQKSEHNDKSQKTENKKASPTPNVSSKYPENNQNKTNNAKGCSRSFYKIIEDQYVLRINLDTSLDPGQTVEYSIDSNQFSYLATLFVYENGKAHLSNFCTDVMYTNLAQPIQKITRYHGSIKAMQNQNNTTTIEVIKLIFFEPKTNERIVFKNEVFCEVKDLGVSG